MFPKEGRVISFQHIRQSLLNEDIPGWRKWAIFLVLVVAIILGIEHFCVYFDFEEASRQLYLSISALVGISAIAQLVGSWFVFKYRVPTYLWVGCAVWVFVTLFWQGLVVVLWSVT
tara:strand:+ start:40 stop:387 length:348 start_codon:yes stop_codon:yes gene_type:complete